LKLIEGQNSQCFTAISDKSKSWHNHSSSLKFVTVILTTFPSKADINSQKIEREEIEPDTEKPKVLHFLKQIAFGHRLENQNWNCERFFGVEESDWKCEVTMISTFKY
jgi:hypothetical protein